MIASSAPLAALESGLLNPEQTARAIAADPAGVRALAPWLLTPTARAEIAVTNDQAAAIAISDGWVTEEAIAAARARQPEKDRAQTTPQERDLHMLERPEARAIRLRQEVASPATPDQAVPGKRRIGILGMRKGASLDSGYSAADT